MEELKKEISELKNQIEEDGYCNKEDFKENYPICFSVTQNEKFSSFLQEDIIYSKVKTNTVYKTKSKLDQFYTNPSIAKDCLDTLKNIKEVKYDSYDLYLEPSAGDGSFLNLLPAEKRVGLDLDPKIDEIIKLDFYSYKPPDS